MSNQRYSEEFKIQPVKQVTEKHLTDSGGLHDRLMTCAIDKHADGTSSCNYFGKKWR